RCRRPDFVRIQQRRYVPACRRICRSYPQGREARQSASPAADRVRAGHQSQDRQNTRSRCAGKSARTRRRGHRIMRRREFITLLGGAAAWPLAVRAEVDRVRRLALLVPYIESDPEGQVRLTALKEKLQSLGWVEGRNIRIDNRWGALNADLMQQFAEELIALHPDLILTQSTPTTAAMLRQTRTIPIVFVQISDPLGSGFVARL